MEHLKGWLPGSRLHAHVHRCIKCGSPDGETVLHARLHSTATQSALEKMGTGNRLCPKCRDKLLPMTGGTRDELDRLSDKLWRDLARRGCLCCQAGLEWHPVEHGG
jgi:hypothetical protein